MEILDSIDVYVGRHFSNEYVRKQILGFSEDVIEQMQKEIDEEKKAGEIVEPEEVPEKE